MKRIEVMAKMQNESVAEEIIDFLVKHGLAEKINSPYDANKLDTIYGLAQYLGEEVENGHE